jgi:hypothetical protein
MNTIVRYGFTVLACVAGLVLAASAAEAQWRVSSADGSSWLTIGVLAQPQAEWLTPPGGGDSAQNLFLRRARFIFGGKVSERITFFIDTDAPNLGKADAAGRKVDERIFLQDAVFTYNVGRSINVEAGMIIVPVARHATQGATTLMAVDYGPFSFTHSDPTGSRAGRDYGVQARGYLANNHVEFRAGVFSGARGAGATAPLRYAVRGVWYPFEAETGLFYTGTSLGARRIVSVGASVDRQDDYLARAIDFFVDQPLAGNAGGVTFQANYTRYDGGTTFVQLPRQDVWFVEAGLFHRRTRLGPFAQWTSRDHVAAGIADESKATGGLAYWAEGHRFNIKAGVARLGRTGTGDRTQVVVQGQVFVF